MLTTKNDCMIAVLILVIKCIVFVAFIGAQVPFSFLLLYISNIEKGICFRTEILAKFAQILLVDALVLVGFLLTIEKFEICTINIGEKMTGCII